MSRVHEALLRAGAGFSRPRATPAAQTAADDLLNDDLLNHVPQVPCRISADALAIDPRHPAEAPIEEFRALRTRLNHLQGRRRLRTLVITSPSPAEGKSFAAINLALAQAQLAENPVLLCDFDFRRPVIHKHFQIERGPGLTDYLLGNAFLPMAMRRIGESNLYVMPAGAAVLNPLELLNLPDVKHLLIRMSVLFHWILLDSPPLLYAADGNLLATLCDATLLVVRIGATSVDAVARARETLCQDNVIGVVVNAARRGELYNRYTYYNSNEASQPPPRTSAASAS